MGINTNPLRGNNKGQLCGRSVGARTVPALLRLLIDRH